MSGSDLAPGTGAAAGGYQVAVVGAGPAGLAAARAAVMGGARVVLVDAGIAPGGQYWRHPPDADTAAREAGLAPGAAAAVPAGDPVPLHHDVRRYRRLLAGLRDHAASGRLVMRPRHQVWSIGRVEGGGFELRAVDRTGGRPRERVIRAGALVLATGAYDRQVPFPGWDLPGVMTAGGVQALLKGSGVRAGDRVLVAGTGPFLMPVAAGLARCGATVVGVHEAAAPTRWLPHLVAVARNTAKLAEGAGYAAALVRHRVPYHTGSTVVAAHGDGDGDLAAVTVARVDAQGRVRPGTRRRVAVDVLAVGWGFTPQLELPLAVGCATRLDVDGSLVAVVDDDQHSTVAGVFVAGEACGVGGAALALAEGEIAGAAAAVRVTRGDAAGNGRAVALRRPRRRRAALRAFATAMHRAYPVPPGWVEQVGDDTLVCRCEEVPAGRLREVVEEYGVRDPRSAKLLARVGMGWCQGRICGYPSACLVASWSGGDFAPGLLAERPVATPIQLGLLAAGPTTEE